MSTTTLTWNVAADHAEPSVWTPARVGLRFLAGIVTLFALGLVPAALLRLELLTPEAGALSADTCGRMISMHGLLMVYFVAIPGLPALMTSFHLPGALGAKRLAFPRLHRAAWFAYAAGGSLMVLAGLLGGVKIGWTFTDAQSALLTQGPVLLTISAVLLVAVATLLNAINAVASVHFLRPAGKRLVDLPVSTWSLYAASLILLIATPVLAATLLYIVADRVFDLRWTVPAAGGDAGFLRQLFWFYATPALYALFLPALGVAADVAEARAGQPLRGRRHVIHALLAMVPLSFVLWGRHFMAAPGSVAFSLTSSLMNHLVLVPVAVMLVLLAATLAGKTSRAEATDLYVWGFVGFSLLGALTGLPLASGALSRMLHNTQFDVAHLHLFISGAVLSAVLAGVYQHLPALTGRQPEAGPARVAAAVTLAGVALTFLPLLALGLKGLPRRLLSYPAEFQVGHVLATAGMTIFLLGLALAGANLLRARRQTVSI